MNIKELFKKKVTNDELIKQFLENTKEEELQPSDKDRLTALEEALTDLTISLMEENV